MCAWAAPSFTHAGAECAKSSSLWVYYFTPPPPPLLPPYRYLFGRETLSLKRVVGRTLGGYPSSVYVYVVLVTVLAVTMN